MIPVGGAVLAFVALAIPSFFFLALRRNRSRLFTDADTKARYGFLYVGLRLVYWDTFDTVRKLAVAAVPVFVGAQPTGSLQALVGQLIVVGTAGLVLALKPYAAAEDNWLVVASQASLFVLLLSGGALKWARLGAWATNAVAASQLALSAGLAAALVLLIVWRYGGSFVAGAKKWWKRGGAVASRIVGVLLCRRGRGKKSKKKTAKATATALSSSASKKKKLLSLGGKVAPSRGSGSGDAEIGVAGGGASSSSSSFQDKIKGKEKAHFGGGGSGGSGGSGSGGSGSGNSNGASGSGASLAPAPSAAAVAGATDGVGAPSASNNNNNTAATLARTESGAGSGAPLLGESPRGGGGGGGKGFY